MFRSILTVVGIARREMRDSARRFLVVIACMTLGVGIIAAVGSLAASIQAGLSRDARAILGGDVEFRLAYRPADAEESRLLSNGGRVSHVIEMRAMARYGAGSPPTLVELKAVDAVYPLYDAVTLSSGRTLAEALAKGRDGYYGAVAEMGLAERLGLRLGDLVEVGAAKYRLAAIVEREPDRALQGISLGPRLLIAQSALDETGLLQPGALVYHLYRVAFADGFDGAEWLQTARGLFSRNGWRIREPGDASRNATRFIERTALFLNLVGFAAMLMGGIGIANGVRAYLERRALSLAVLKCLGATSPMLFAIYGLQVMAIAIIGTVLGLGIGIAVPFLAAHALAGFGLRILPGFYPEPLGFSALLGFAAAASFTLAPLLRARRIRPAQLFRSLALELGNLQAIDHVPLGLMAALLALLTLAGSADKVIGISFILMAGAALLLFRVLAAAIRRAARFMHANWLIGAWPLSLRLALGALARSQTPIVGIIVSLGLGLTVLVAIGLVQRGLTADIEENLPRKAPSFYFIDIQPEQVASFDAALTAFPTAGELERVPMLRGRIVRLKDRPVESLTPPDNLAWVLQSDRGITWSAAAPAGAELAAGSWWPSDYSGPPLVSFDAEAAEGFGLAIGDSISVNILGREINARIANLRRINWRGLDINFVMIFSPGLIAAAPQTHIATIRVAPDRESALVTAIAAKFPNVSAIRVKDALAAAERLLDAVGWAVRAAAGIALFIGVLVLAGTLAAGQQRRIYESVLLKTLGGTRRDVILSYLAEFALLAGLSGIIAFGVGGAGAYLFLTRVLDIDWRFDPILAVWVMGLSLVLALGAGLAGSWRALGAKAAPFLRNE